MPIRGATYFSLTHLLLFIPSISAISPIVLGTWQKSTIFCSVSVKFDLCRLVQSCRLLCRQQVLKPNSEVHEIGYNFNLGLGETLLSTALHDEGDTAPPGFHRTTAIEYIGYGGIEGHGAYAVVHKIFPAHTGRECTGILEYHAVIINGQTGGEVICIP